MNNSYIDIRSRISDSILWWDEYAVPRYEKFSPRSIANIYAEQVALVEIACQNCGQIFLVAISADWLAVNTKSAIDVGIKEKSLHYGDPPNIDCCPAGPTMNCDDLRVVEYWQRDDLEWVRVPELEVYLDARPN